MTSTSIPVVEPVRSLIWEGHDLVDILSGLRWGSDEGQGNRQFNYAFGQLDRALVSPSGRYHLLYAERGTKALLLRDGKLLREVDRSYYHADDYDYPAALGLLPDGREVLVHCPDRYNVLEVEELSTGRRLTSSAQRDPDAAADIFHSQLTMSPDGLLLVSAGWVWQPWGVVQVYDLLSALDDPRVLDEPQTPLQPDVNAEVEAARWLDADRLLVSTNPDEEALDDESAAGLSPGELGVWSASGQTWLHRHTFEHRVGALVPWGDNVLALYGHPKLIDPVAGTLLQEWRDVQTGNRHLCFGVTHIPSPVVAVHPDGTRAAVGTNSAIVILER